MFRRLLLGLVLGAIVGGLVAAALVAGLHISIFGLDTGGILLTYATAALTGVLTGLVAGKPIWAAGAKIEAGLKALFGALIAAGLMFALRRWVHVQPNLAFLAPGQEADIVRAATIGQFPALSLPIVAALLGGFFELDNTGDAAEAPGKDVPNARKRVADGKSNGKARRPEEEEDGDAEEAAPVAASKRAKR